MLHLGKKNNELSHFAAVLSYILRCCNISYTLSLCLYVCLRTVNDKILINAKYITLYVNMKKWIAIFSGLLIFHQALAQEQVEEKKNEFSMGVQIRSRGEYRNGALFPRSEGDEPATFINNRARLWMSYKRDRLSLKVSGQHVGVWGQDPQIERNGRFMLNEAWANLDLGSGFFTKVGRQSLVYDDERILGGLDWNISGRFYDALKLGYEDVKNKVHLILAFNQNEEKIIGGSYYAPGGQPFKNMQTLWYKYANGKSFDGSFLFMNLGQEAGDAVTQDSDTKYMQTTGANLAYYTGGFRLTGTFYYQFGKTVTDRDISALLWSVSASYAVNPKWKLMLASDYLSGDKGDKPDKLKAFNPLYGTHHKFYGTMDYFYASSFVNGHNPGLWDNQLGVTFSPVDKLSLMLNYHCFSTVVDMYDGAEKLKKHLGSEVDFQLSWNIMPDVSLSTGYSTMFGTQTMKAVKGGQPSRWQDWGWISLNINPTVFFSKW